MSESFDDRRKVGGDGSKSKVHAGVGDRDGIGLPVGESADDGLKEGRERSKVSFAGAEMEQSG